VNQTEERAFIQHSKIDVIVIAFVC